MRLVTYRGRRAQSDWQCGAVRNDRVIPVSDLLDDRGVSRTWTTRGVLQEGPDLWSALDEKIASSPESSGAAIGAVTLGPPMPDPDKIICLGLNYRDHARESGMAEPQVPMIFAKFRNSLVGPEDSVVLPEQSDAIDYEAELAVVIGRRAKGVSAAQALDHVAGVTVLNDITARDLQHATSQWGAGKAIDTFAPCGPALVFLDEVDDVQNLVVRTRVNDQVVQDGNTRDMIFDIPATIEFLTRTMTLEPGDIIATGTPAGVGISRDPKILLADGDKLETEIEGIGVLRNRIVASAPAGV